MRILYLRGTVVTQNCWLEIATKMLCSRLGGYPPTSADTQSYWLPKITLNLCFWPKPHCANILAIRSREVGDDEIFQATNVGPITRDLKTSTTCWWNSAENSPYFRFGITLMMSFVMIIILFREYVIVNQTLKIIVVTSFIRIVFFQLVFLAVWVSRNRIGTVGGRLFPMIH